MATVEEKYQFTTAEESILERDWAAGSSKVTEVTEYVISANPSNSGPKYVAGLRKVKYAPAWLKAIDEPIVNALDHMIRCAGTDNPVTWIRINFDETGRVKVSNNGPGLEVVEHKEASAKLGRDVWVPEFVFGELFQGSNRKKRSDSIIGGTNGLGAKVSNCFSDEFIVETVDGVRNLYYVQRWRNHMKNRDPRCVINLNEKCNLPADKRLPHTLLSFLPSYKHFGYDAFTREIYQELVDIVRTRAIYAAAYAKFATAHGPNPRAKIEVSFNGDPINITGMADIAQILFPKSTFVRTLITPDLAGATPKRAPYHYPWEVCVVIFGTEDEESCQTINQISNVNGIVVSSGGHTKYLMTKLVEGVKEKIVRVFSDKNMQFKPSYVTGNIFLLANTQIPETQWTGQRKDVLSIDAQNLAGYKFDGKFIKSITDKLKDQIVNEIFNENNKVKRKRTTTTDYDKYKPARKSESRKAETRAKCSLLATEGDSAMTQVCTGITNNPKMGFEYYGVISLGGVIINVRKECVISSEKDGSRRLKRSTKLDNNAFMKALCQITGLNPVYRYDPESPTYKREMSELNYGCIIACVDQDYDGVGNIFGLLLNIFELFWPHLVQAGYVKRFDTPKIRAYPKKGGSVLEFYNDDEYDVWSKSLADKGQSTDAYNIKYYKGLGTHSRDETIHMFKRFREHLFTYKLDERSARLFNVYYGDDPNLRKVALAQPVAVPTRETIVQQFATMSISCSDHLEYETKIFQKDSIERHLDHALDGFNQSGRMIFDGSQKAFRNSNKEMKVAQLAGYISEHENYHHGESSLSDSITGKAFITVGGKQIPQLLPYGQFGSRLKGGKDAAHPRYIWTKLNKAAMDVIYPDVDYWLLDFVFDEGKRGAPKYYLPIVPSAILESTELPGHGWKLKTWGRNIFNVISNVRHLIRNGDDATLLSMPPFTHGWQGRVELIRGEPYSFGAYSVKANGAIIHIYELPLRVWTSDYIDKLRKKAAADPSIIAGVIDFSDDRVVNIEVRLRPGAIEKLQNNGWGDSVFTDPIEEYFQLRDRMDSNLNMVGARGEVIEFKTYEQIIHYWFPYRKELYIKRVDHQCMILRLKIRYYENVIRYINECLNLNIVKMRVAQMEQTLATSKPPYDRIYRARLFNPKFTPTEELEEVILRGKKANYDYILDLTDRNKSEESLAEFGRKLSAVREELEALEIKASKDRFRGARIWEEELDALERVVRNGLNTDWMGDEKNKYKFD